MLVARTTATVTDVKACVQVVNPTNQPYYLEGCDLLAAINPIEETQIKGKMFEPLPPPAT